MSTLVKSPTFLDRKGTFNYKDHYRVTTMGNEYTPDRSSAELIKKSDLNNSPSPYNPNNPRLHRVLSNESNILVQ